MDFKENFFYCWIDCPRWEDISSNECRIVDAISVNSVNGTIGRAGGAAIVRFLPLLLAVSWCFHIIPLVSYVGEFLHLNPARLQKLFVESTSCHDCRITVPDLE
jgi:hypothetical protein